MGTNGASLYDNDLASDIRADYIHFLRLGNSNEKTTECLIKKYDGILSEEEIPIFWFALADTQWEYGRLLKSVKNKAEYFIRHMNQYEWKTAFYEQKWIHTVEALKERLDSPLPNKKRVKKHQLYESEWNLGDVYAYQFHTENSKTSDAFEKYIVFRVITKAKWWPGHIVPVVQFYKWIGTPIPKIPDISVLPSLELGFYPSALKNHPNYPKEYRAILVCTSEKSIPDQYLSYLGNINGSDLIPFDPSRFYGIPAIGWEKEDCNHHIEEYVLDFYRAWREV